MPGLGLVAVLLCLFIDSRLEGRARSRFRWGLVAVYGLFCAGFGALFIASAVAR